MPLINGRSAKVVSKNIKELMDSYKKKGSIGTSGPLDEDEARKRAIAIAMSKKRRSK